MGYAVKIGTKAVEVVTGGEDVLVESASASGARKKWGGGELRSRTKPGPVSRVVQQGAGWVVEKDSPYGGSPYASPLTSPFINGNGSAPGTPFGPPPAFGPVSASPHARSPSLHSPTLHAKSPSYGSGFTPRSPYMPSSLSRSSSLQDPSTESLPSTPAAGYGVFPPTPNPATTGFGLGLGLNGNGNGIHRSLSDSSNNSKKAD